MKKIMIGLAIAAFATCANASMVYWGFTTATSKAANFDAAQDLTGYSAYLIAAADWNADDVAGSLAKAQDSAEWSTASFVSPKAQFKTGNVKSTGLDLAVGKNDFYVVLANDDKYWTSALQQNIDVLADGDISTSYTKIAISLTNDSSVKAADMKSIGGDVPEPTSGLLLLLGMAGLALRRKNA